MSNTNTTHDQTSPLKNPLIQESPYTSQYPQERKSTQAGQSGDMSPFFYQYCCCFITPRGFWTKTRGVVVDWFGGAFTSSPSLGSKSTPIFLLGKEYAVSERKEGGNSVESEQKKSDGSSLPPHTLEFLASFRSIIWIMYRKDFPPVGSALFTSDAGWGCMIRTGQMMLAQAYTRQFLGADWNIERSGDMGTYEEIISWFRDSSDISSPYSIHNILHVSADYGVEAGSWFSPSAIGNALQLLVNSHSPRGVCMLICRDGSIYKDQVKQTATKSKAWCPIIIYLPLRLGLDNINPIYTQQILQVFRWVQSIGIVGGRPGASYYFVGAQENNLFYLDPHYVKSSRGDARSVLESYKSPSPRRMSISDLDPSLAMGFLCSTEEQFDDLCDRITHLSGTPFATVFNKMPSYVASSMARNSPSPSVDRDEQNSCGYTIVNYQK